jgi:superfamily I DNA and/or RNA helicase
MVEAGISEEDITLLTQCKAQFERFEECIQKFPSQRMLARTIDGFQGGEREVVRLSTVVGHLNEVSAQSSRINVGTSRQRELLILIGNMKVLRDSKWLQMF